MTSKFWAWRDMAMSDRENENSGSGAVGGIWKVDVMDATRIGGFEEGEMFGL